MSEKQESLLQAMEREASEERKKLEAAYLKQVQEIKEKAEKEVQKLHEDETRLVDRKLIQEKARRIGKADQEVRNSTLLTKHKLVGDLLNEVENQLLKLREQRDLYSRIFREMLTEALNDSSGEVVIRLNPLDVKQCQSVLNDCKRNGKIEADDKISGGVVLVGQNGRVTVLNSLQSRIASRREMAIEEAAKVLFKEVS